MSATWSLACATAVTLWLLPSSLYSEELKSGVAIPTTIVTDGSVKTESHGNTTVYLIDTAIHQKSSAHLTINGDFRIVTNGIVHIEEDASGKRIEVIPKKDATAELSTKQKAIVACRSEEHTSESSHRH